MGGLAAGAFGAVALRADELPRNTDPRAISGDTVEPDWRERLTVTVGRKKADLVGVTDRVIQAAVDYVARLGGGAVRVLPGTYRMRNSVFLPSKVRLLGSGSDSVLVKEPSVTTRLIVDGDHWDQEVTLADPTGFQVGDGVRLVSKDPYGKGTNIVQRTLIAAVGNRFKLDRRLEERFHLAGDPGIATNFSLLQCTDVAEVTIENLALDGNKAQNEMLDRGGIGGFELACRRNIVYYQDGKAVGGYGSRRIGRDVCAFDRNLYWNASGRPVLFGDKTLAEWRAAGQDKESIVANPLFVAPEKGDFRLRQGSPAAKIGFEPWDLSAVGPRPRTARLK